MATLESIRKRLDAALLEHLKEHVTELAERLDWANRATARAEDAAEYWREQCESLIAQMANMADVGLTQGGDLVLMPVADDAQGVDIDAVHARCKSARACDAISDEVPA